MSVIPRPRCAAEEDHAVCRGVEGGRVVGAAVGRPAAHRDLAPGGRSRERERPDVAEVGRVVAPVDQHARARRVVHRHVAEAVRGLDAVLHQLGPGGRGSQRQAPHIVHAAGAGRAAEHDGATSGRVVDHGSGSSPGGHGAAPGQDLRPRRGIRKGERVDVGIVVLGRVGELSAEHDQPVANRVVDGGRCLARGGRRSDRRDGRPGRNPREPQLPDVGQEVPAVEAAEDDHAVAHRIVDRAVIEPASGAGALGLDVLPVGRAGERERPDIRVVVAPRPAVHQHAIARRVVDGGVVEMPAGRDRAQLQPRAGVGPGEVAIGSRAVIEPAEAQRVRLERGPLAIQRRGPGGTFAGGEAQALPERAKARGQLGQRVVGGDAWARPESSRNRAGGEQGQDREQSQCAGT